MNESDEYERYRHNDDLASRAQYAAARGPAIQGPRLTAVIGGVAATVAIVGTLLTALWAYAGVSSAAGSVPAIIERQNADHQDISTLKVEQVYTDSRYGEILTQLKELDTKMNTQGDRINNVYDQQQVNSKQLRGWAK